MELKLHGESNSTVTVSDYIFTAKYNQSLIHQVLVSYMAGARSGTKAQKNRAAVRGGGRKPWRQKGLGRARAGTIRSPIWRGGGMVFAATPKAYVKKVNKKMYRQAMCSILSELMRKDALMCIELPVFEQVSTKDASVFLKQLGLDNVLIVVEEIAEKIWLSLRNLPYVDMIEVASLNPYQMILHDKVLFTQGAMSKIEEWLGE